MEKVYEFVYSSCIYEERPVTHSLHRTKKGAEIAMEFHKESERKQWEETKEAYLKEHNEEYPFEFGKMEYWGVNEIEIQD